MLRVTPPCLRRFKTGAFLCGLLFDGCLLGCQAHGHRKFEIEIAGMTFRIEDQTANDETGKPNYQAGFDKDDSFARWLFGKSNATPVTLVPLPDPDPEPEPTP